MVKIFIFWLEEWLFSELKGQIALLLKRRNLDFLEYRKLRNELQVCRAFRLQFNVQTDKMKDTGLLLIQILRLNVEFSVEQRLGGSRVLPSSINHAGQGLHWLKEKFNNRVIRRLMDHPWPSRSPDLSSLDYTGSGVCSYERGSHCSTCYC